MSEHESLRDARREIVQIAGRWARLDNGDFITPVPAFHAVGYDRAEFDRRIARFQADPVAELTRCGIAECLPASRSKSATRRLS